MKLRIPHVNPFSNPWKALFSCNTLPQHTHIAHNSPTGMLLALALVHNLDQEMPAMPYISGGYLHSWLSRLLLLLLL